MVVMLVTNRPDLVMVPSGTRVYFDRIAATPVTWADLSHYLPRIKRYNSGVDWTLLQHHVLCVLMAENLEWSDSNAESMLLVRDHLACHDFSEVYMVDVPSGLKRYCEDFKGLEDQMQEHIQGCFGLTPLTPEEAELAHRVDKCAVLYETAVAAPTLYRYLTTDGGHTCLTLEQIRLARQVQAMSVSTSLELIKNLLGEPKNGKNDYGVSRT